MTTTEPVPDAPLAPGPDRGQRRSLPLWGHLLLLLVVLLGVAAVTAPHGSFVADDGSYQLQLRALDQGSWNLPSGTEQLDPDGTHYPVPNADKTADGFAPSAKHPAWPWLANAISPVTGVDHAFLALGILGVIGLAAAAWLLAAEHDPTWSRWAFWLAGTAPVVVTAAVPWAHAAATATAGFAVLGAVRLVRRPPSVLPVLMLLGGVAATTVLRTEGLLLAGAVAVALVVGGRQAARSWRWSLAWGAGTAALALVVVRAEGAWIRSITGGATTTFRARSSSTGINSAGFVEGRVQGAIRSVFDSARPSMTLLLAVAVIAAAVYAWLAASGRPGMVARWQAASLFAIVVLVLRLSWLSNYPVSGVLAAWPVAVAGLAAALPVAWRRVRMEVVVVGVYALAVFGTQYPDGGGGSWGARFFALGTVPLVVVLALGVQRLLAVQPVPSPSAVTVRRFLLGLMVVPFLLGLAVVHDVQTGTDGLYSWIDDHVEEMVVTETELPRMMWRNDIQWLRVDAQDLQPDLAGLLGSLAADRDAPSEITLIVLDEHLSDADAAVTGQADWEETSRTHRDDITVVVLRR